MAGNDLRNMTPEIQEILTNRDVIAVDQDALGREGRRVWKDGDEEVWAKQQQDGSRAVVLLNRGNSEREDFRKVAADRLSRAPSCGSARPLVTQRIREFHRPIFSYSAIAWSGDGDDTPIRSFARNSIPTRKTPFAAKSPQYNPI